MSKVDNPLQIVVDYSKGKVRLESKIKMKRNFRIYMFGKWHKVKLIK